MKKNIGDGLTGLALTPQENRIAVLLARGMPQKEMADEIKISIHTLYVHLKNMRLKMKCRSSAECTAFLAGYFD